MYSELILHMLGLPFPFLSPLHGNSLESHMKIWKGWQRAGGADLHTLHSPRWCHLRHTSGRNCPPPPDSCYPDRAHQASSKTVSWAALVIYFRLYKLQRVQETLIPRACENRLECVNQSLHSPMTPPTASLQLRKPSQISPPTFFPWSLGKECVSSRHWNAQPLACTFK